MMSNLSERMQNTFNNQDTTVAIQVAEQTVYGGIKIHQDFSRHSQLKSSSPFHSVVS